MLFASIHKVRQPSEGSQQRLLHLFTQWKPPRGFAIRAHYAFTDGTGGLLLVDAETPAAAYEAVVPWVPFLEFHTVPILEVDKAVPIALGALAWRDSVK